MKIKHIASTCLVGCTTLIIAATATLAKPGDPTNAVFKSRGTIENARFKGIGDASLVLSFANNNGSLGLMNAGRFSIEYIGNVQKNFEGKVQLRVSKFRSSEKGFRTVPASGTCNIETSDCTRVIRSICTVQGSAIDHGRSVFTTK